ncbi:PPK2 family polyphosphate kinase [Hamadaea sp.]|uniref:PPK2 family polyphosphate kinase n=1 Tax=Hamadaea sp. TaxID=2024425 RepID=UPI0025C20FA0|nr:PPK2 family polyphosphate kinase [Hamadaea sp.]
MARRLTDLLRVPPSGVDLGAIDPRSTPGLPKAAGKDPKSWARAQLPVLGEELFGWQEKLFAAAKSGASRQRLLLVLQAMDCGGKDGTIKKVVGQFNPQGVHIVSFGKPTEEELAHDFLWRIERGLPGPGVVGVFNRSHYEDVLVVRVHNLVPARTWRARYAKINRFEQQVVADGCAVVKVMLHISRDEQKQRLLDRLDDPTKYWKYNPGDVDERALWPAYQEAYAEALGRCDRDEAPWYVVPADRKWYRDWAVANLLLEKLREINPGYPPADFDPDVERGRLVTQPEVNSG